MKTNSKVLLSFFLGVALTILGGWEMTQAAVDNRAKEARRSEEAAALREADAERANKLAIAQATAGSGSNQIMMKSQIAALERIANAMECLCKK